MSFGFGSYLAPSSIDASLGGGTTNDWAPSGHATADIIWITASSASTLNGLQGGSDGRVVILMLRLGSSTVTLANEAAGSSAANRFGTLASGTLSISGVVGRCLMWDGGTSRWRPWSL